MDELKKVTFLNEELESENQILKNSLEKYRNTINNLKKENEENVLLANQRFNDLNEEKKIIQDQLNSILYSRSYKIIQKIKRIIKRR